MKIPLPPAVQPTNEMLTLIAAIDEFKGEWRALGNLGPEILRTLRRIASIESAGSSTRIEGAKLSDGEVDQLVGRLGKESFQSRDKKHEKPGLEIFETATSQKTSAPMRKVSYREGLRTKPGSKQAAKSPPRKTATKNATPAKPLVKAAAKKPANPETPGKAKKTALKKALKRRKLPK